MRIKKLTILAFCVIFLVICTEASAQTRIRFARGRTSSSVAGQIASGGVRTFVLGARDGQTLSANVSSKSGCVKFTEGSTSTSFATTSGDNFMSITNYCGRATSFLLTVSIAY